MSCWRMIFIVLLCFYSQRVWANGFTVQGFISYPKTGDLRVALVTQEQYQAEVPSPYRLVLATKQTGPATLEFQFNNVSAGTYAVQCFQDVNGNGKLDEGLFGPTEPWGFYRPSRPAFRAPHFDEIAFPITRSIQGIALRLK